ncbi:putative iron-siderophore ABC transporter permease/ATP-binding protein [Gordonia effusa NBRC 100432]|uniref:Putative iron-siderophore ABC transporter permease/ATP-binding protein n=1 Tax=Gordonia effusa NBRC 100432 TaxID=1077974 RepID=H0R2E9_9ACTN|nr:ABC transporter ATP-binding protein [Gordonia effusa]GAB19250.1 putative iron-siderophore ABC transporter permease/ATP-binding protein [Gordonia effusa NBRC 100432]
MIRTLLSLLPAQSRPGLTRFLALAIVSVIARAVSVVVLVPLLSALLDGENSTALAWVGALTVATLVGWTADSAASKVSYDLGFTLLNSAQHGVAERLSRIKLTWFSASNTATARQAIAATGPDLVGVVIYLVVPLLSAVLLPIVIALALIPIAWPLAIVAALGVPLMLAALWGTGAISQHADHVADEANSEMTERVIEFARTQPALRIARRSGAERSLAGDAVANQHGALLRLILMQIPGQLLFSLASQIALFALAGTAAWLTVRGDLSAAQAVALIVVAVRYLEPFTVVGELAGGLETIRITLRRIGSVLQAPIDSEGTAQPAQSGRAPRIEFEKVSFHYGDPAYPVLDELDLTLDAGAATAIIGPSGSGKSTILSLVAGLHEPTAGRILIDGVDSTELDLAARRSLVSMVFQQPHLMPGTIADNILAGHPEASTEAVARASGLARVDEITDRLPDGAQSMVGEGGGSLSGGERQRVSIARALLKPAPILLIDEATSALDNENERAIVDALSAGDERTRVIVAHRRAGIRNADRVVVIDRGRVVESGTTDELLAAGGRFATFWEHRGAAASWKITEEV